MARLTSRLAIAITLASLGGPSVAIGQASGSAVGPAETGVIVSRPDPEGVPTKLTLGFYLMDIESIEDLKREFTADLYVVARWRDSRLALADDAGEGAQRILPLSKIWRPEIGIVNRRGIEFSLPQTARVDSKGNVEATQRLRGQFASLLDLRRFPFDRQELEIQFVSYRYSSDELEIEPARVLWREGFTADGWQIGQPVSEVTPLEIPSATGRAGLTLRVTAEREKTFYVLTMVLPLTLIALMAWSVFWIDPSLLPSQLAIATASVFTLIAFRLSLKWSLPKVSYLTAADTFVLAVTLLVFAALGETVVAGRFSKSGRDDLARTLDRWARWIYLAALVIICLVTMASGPATAVARP